LLDIVQKVKGDLGNGDVVNIQLVPLDEKEHEVEWAFEQG
jgi:translation initiation factor IF-1